MCLFGSQISGPSGKLSLYSVTRQIFIDVCVFCMSYKIGLKTIRGTPPTYGLSNSTTSILSHWVLFRKHLLRWKHWRVGIQVIVVVPDQEQLQCADVIFCLVLILHVCVGLMRCDQGDMFKASKRRGVANIMQDGAVDLQYGSGVVGNLHHASKANTPSRVFCISRPTY